MVDRIDESYKTLGRWERVMFQDPEQFASVAPECLAPTDRMSSPHTNVLIVHDDVDAWRIREPLPCAVGASVVDHDRPAGAASLLSDVLEHAT